jgi:hypothetical protein
MADIAESNEVFKIPISFDEEHNVEQEEILNF